MKTSYCLQSGTILALLLLSGCNCSVNCFRGEPARETAVAFRDIHFAFDSADLTPTAKKTLQEDFKNLGLGESQNTAQIVLEGRADERGSPGYNFKLSEKRVAAVQKFLNSLGADPSRFESRELGEQEPVATGSNPDSWAQNRSVRVWAK